MFSCGYTREYLLLMNLPEESKRKIDDFGILILFCITIHMMHIIIISAFKPLMLRHPTYSTILIIFVLAISVNCLT